jgi:hypothetical protein
LICTRPALLFDQEHRARGENLVFEAPAAPAVFRMVRVDAQRRQNGGLEAMRYLIRSIYV